MVGLKVKASSLVELLVATIIICISFGSVSIVLLHYGYTFFLPVEQQILGKLTNIENQILLDETFPLGIEKYEEEGITFNYSRILHSDSILKVELIYADSLESKERSKSFIYVKD